MNTDKLHYRIEIRDKDFNLYKDKNGKRVTKFEFEDNEKDENLVHFICESVFNDYLSICKEGSVIMIEVSYFNNISKTYSCLYSFYGDENKFIKN
jgi:hypothetical protein